MVLIKSLTLTPRCKLLHCETKSVLKPRCAWDQLKPKVNSMLQHANGEFKSMDLDQSDHEESNDLKPKVNSMLQHANDELKSMHLDQSDHEESNDLSNIDESYKVESLNDVVNMNQIDQNSNVSSYNLAAAKQRFANLIDSSEWATSDKIDDFSELIKKLKNISGLQSILVFSYLSSHDQINFIESSFPSNFEQRRKSLDYDI